MEATFVESCVAGNATLDQLDSWIEGWHKGEIGRSMELRELLGMTCYEYSAWMKDPAAINSIVDERKAAAKK